MPLPRNKMGKNVKGKRERKKENAQNIKWKRENGCQLHPDVNMEECKNFMRAKNASGERKCQEVVMLMNVKDNDTMCRAVTDKFGKNFDEFKEVMKKVDTVKIPSMRNGEVVERNMWDMINEIRDSGQTDPRAHKFADQQHFTTIKAILTHMWGQILLEKAWGFPDMVEHFEDMAFTLTGDGGGSMDSTSEKSNYICGMRWYEGQKRGIARGATENPYSIDMSNDKYWEVILTPNKEMYETWVEETTDSWEDVEASQERLGKQIHSTFGFDLLSSIFTFSSSFDNFQKVMDEE